MAQLVRPLPTVIKRNSRQPTVVPKTFDPLWDQHEIFEIDRSNVILQLRSLRHAIDEGAEEMEMVAIERVFSKSLSGALTRGGQKLRLAARDLNHVLRLVEGAHVARMPRRSDRKTKPGNRRKARN